MSEPLSIGLREEEPIPSPQTTSTNPLHQWIQEKIQSCTEGNILDLAGDANMDWKRPDAAPSDSFDNIFYLNLVDYTPVSRELATTVYSLLRPEGHLIFWWRATSALFNESESGFKYWHRNNKAEITKVLTDKFKIVKIRYCHIMNAQDSQEQQPLFPDLLPQFNLEDIPPDRQGLAAIVFVKKEF